MDQLIRGLDTLLVVAVVSALAPIVVACSPGRGSRRSWCSSSVVS
jgi:hypothetical protein